MDLYVYKATVVSVHDGDTIKCDLDLGLGVWSHGINVRLNGCNARELGTPGAKEARDNLRMVLPPGTELTLRSVGWDKYGGRIDADVIYDNTDLAAELIADDWLAPWDGTGPRPVPPWPRHVG